MADIKLGQNPDVGAIPQAGSEKEKLDYLLKAYPALMDAYVRLQRDLENAMQSLDSSNVRAIDGHITAVTNLDMVVNSIITNTLITQSLYAERGYIAELTVDKLDTSTKVQNYLLHGTDHAASVADVNYIKVHEQTITYYTAVAINHPATVQATDRNGHPLFWQVIGGVVTHQATTLVVTDYPVLTWTYTDTIKMEQTFKLVDGIYTPQTLYGAGTGVNNNAKGIVYKAYTGGKHVFHLGYFHSTDGTEYGITIDDDGVHIEGHYIEKNMVQIWVGTEFPAGSKLDDLLVKTDDYSRHDVTLVSGNTTLTASGSELIIANGTNLTITLYDGLSTSGGADVKIIVNTGSTLVTVAPGANLDYTESTYLYPGATAVFYITHKGA